MCLEQGMPADYTKYAGAKTLLVMLCRCRGIYIPHVELLIRYNADVNWGYGVPIRSAVYDNYLDVVILLIKAGVDVNLCGIHTSAISEALSYASFSIVEQLLKAGAILPDDALALAYETHRDSAQKVLACQKS